MKSENTTHTHQTNSIDNVLMANCNLFTGFSVEKKELIIQDMIGLFRLTYAILNEKH